VIIFRVVVFLKAIFKMFFPKTFARSFPGSGFQKRFAKLTNRGMTIVAARGTRNGSTGLSEHIDGTSPHW
jgi:hypothetical protein